MVNASHIDPLCRGECASRRGDAAIADLARRQHGVVARSQLMRLGLGRRAIDHRVERARLHVVQRGIYAVGHDMLSERGRWMAAVLAGGGGAVLSHRSAAALWRLRPSARKQAELTVPRRRGRRPAIQFHQAPLPADEVTVHDGIPVTTVARTLLDLARAVDQRQVERAINEAEVLRLWDDVSLAALLERYPRRAGSRKVRGHCVTARRARPSLETTSKRTSSP